MSRGTTVMFVFQDVYAMRENLGDCFIDSEIDDTSNALLDFLKEFGLG